MEKGKSQKEEGESGKNNFFLKNKLIYLFD